ncbi:MAG: PAS domain S-box protein [Desulfobacteraceae bacterium]|nr:MAG: PAS domain S-box protein [Desulfobacteraceae bacterium]
MTTTAKPTFFEFEESLRESEAFYQSLFALYPFPMTLTRLHDGVLIFASDAFCGMFGYSRNDIENSITDSELYIDPQARRRLIEQVRKEGQVRGFEIHLRSKDGTVHYKQLSACIVPIKACDYLLSVFTFSNPLKLVQSELRQSNERFGTILENISEGYYEVDLRGNFTFFNHAMEVITGYSHEELMGMNYRAYTPPEDAKRVAKGFNEVFSTSCSGKIVDYAIARKDGAMVLVESSASMLRDASGRPIGFYGILRDRTERKKAEDAMRQSEESYRQLLDMAPDSISVTRVDDGRFMQVNDVFCKRTGYKAEEVIGRTASELGIYVDPTSRKRIFEALRQRGRIESMEIKFRSKSGHMLDNLISARPIKYRDQDCLLAVTTNIGSLKQAQSALRQSEEKYRQILETMEEGYYELDLRGNFTYFNESMRRLHGYPAEELMGMNYRKYLYPERAQKNRKAFMEIYETGVSVKISEYEIIRKDGSVRLAEMSSYPLKDSAGNTIGFWGISRDRTAQKQAELALQKSEEQYRLLVQNANDGIYITQDGRIKFFNPKTLAISGYTAQEMFEMAFLDLVHPEDKQMFELHRRKLEQEHMPEVFSFRILNKEAEELWVDLSVISISWEGRPAALNFLRDITLQKKMEALLLQSRKMEAVGTLAGGIAHDFNNLLMGIQGNTSLAMLDIGKEHAIYDKLKSIEQYVKAGANLTKQLLGTARGGKYEVRPTDLNKVADASADLFGRTHKEICIHKKLHEALWTVEVDKGQIEQVLLNLYVNAWHAMPESGHLYIETHNVFLEDFYVQPYGLQPGKYVKLSVTDTGIGIDPRDLKRIFDPFFTTRSMSRGTGLGLASAYGIVSNHGGIITVYSEKGSGTTFCIYLPASEKSAVAYVEPKMEIHTGRETILFVDDEEGIVEIGNLILQKLGYKVITAKSGAEAVAAYRQKKEVIDLVLLDMIMPGMSGGETFNELKSLNADVKVVLSSGYSINGQAKNIIDRGCKGFIQKPFSMQDLSLKLRQVLDRKE